MCTAKCGSPVYDSDSGTRDAIVDPRVDGVSHRMGRLNSNKTRAINALVWDMLIEMTSERSALR